MSTHEVVIAGGGPTGLTLAAELQLAGVDVVVVERRASQEIDQSRAGGLHARTLEMLDQRGVVDRFVAAGQPFPSVGFAGLQLDIGDFPTRHNYTLALWQREFELLLGAWVIDELGVAICREADVVGCTQDADGAALLLADGTTVSGQYVVGCDGGRSVVRKSAGIEFPGFDASASFMIAEIEMTGTPPIGMRPEGGGLGPVNPGVSDGHYRVVLREQRVDHDTDPTFDDLTDALAHSYGDDFGVHSPKWISRFTDMSRQAATYRAARVFVAGDAAHVHGPMGGQGLNVGVQDAFNLGWKLARVLRGASPDALLDTYHDERHPVGARVIHNTMAQVALSTVEDRAHALREIAVDLLAMDQPRRHIVGMISGLDVHYDLGGNHPLVGRRVPDFDLAETRVFELLHLAQPVVLQFGGAVLDAAGVRVVHATDDGPWELPVIGAVRSVDVVLVRPDGYVSFAGDADDPALPAAIAALRLL